jgi:prepilin-type processing-associated H-X9-DG protein
MVQQEGGSLCTPAFQYSVSSTGVVQSYAFLDFPTDHWVQNSYSKVIANVSTGSCSGTGTGTLYAVQVAAKANVVFALGGDSGASYTGGPGNVYYFDGHCWQEVLCST